MKMKRSISALLTVGTMISMVNVHNICAMDTGVAYRTEKAGIVKTNAPLAVDGSIDTAATAPAETAAGEGAFMFELDGKNEVTKIVLEKQSQPKDDGGYGYWADWVFAVGCELQGSMDGNSWETIRKMIAKPDGLVDNTKEVVFVSDPKPYKFIRYIRTTVKDSNAYGAWAYKSDNGNRLNLGEIDIYTRRELPGMYLEQADITSTNAGAAIDGDANTSATAPAATAAGDGAFVFELNGTDKVNSIVIKKQYQAGGVTKYNYWGDWVLATGCELQGSMDGESWETVAVMNTWPDDVPDELQEVAVLEESKPYKYIRYIRTTVKNNKSYGAWLFTDDNGNRLNLAEIEVYYEKETQDSFPAVYVVCDNVSTALGGKDAALYKGTFETDSETEISAGSRLVWTVIKNGAQAGDDGQYNEADIRTVDSEVKTTIGSGSAIICGLIITADDISSIGDVKAEFK